MPAMKPVYSSTVNTIGYDEATKELHVEFQAGKTAVYKDVPPKLASQVMNAPSIGSALHSMVKPFHEFSYLGDDE